MGPNTFRPANKAEEYAGSVIQAVPSAMLGPTRLAAKGLQALGQGVGGQLGEDVTKGTKYDRWGRLVGTLIGSGAMPGSLYGTKETTSGKPDYDEAVRLLEDRGVKLTAGQKLNSRGLRLAENELGGGTFDKFIQGQSDQFTQGIMGDLGFPGRRATPENLAAARQQIGGTMDDLASTTSVPFDAKLQNDLTDIGARYEQVAGTIATGPKNTIYRIIDMATQGKGVIEGEAYKNIVTRIRELADSSSGDTQQALNDMRDALDNAVARNMGPEQAAAWQGARDKYRGLMTVERSMGGRGQGAAGFDIEPGALRSAITSEGPASVAEARNPLTPKANAGVEVLTDRPNTNTAARAATRLGVAAGAGALGFGAAGGPGLAFLAAPYLAGKVLMHPITQSFLAPDAKRRAILAQLLAGSTGTARDRPPAMGPR
jgi:hypothetical protein